MRAVTVSQDAGTPVPRVGEVDDPRPGRGEVLVRVRATALNRADLLQLRGLYPPPPGESEVPGLECSGEIVELGEDVESWKVGDRVMALLAGGGQAELAAVPEGQLMAIPYHLDFAQAAALPEAAITSWTNLVYEGWLEEEESVLITAAASGVGTFAVQLAREIGARVLVAGRSLERLERLRELGADVCVELGDDLPGAVLEATGGEGVNLVMDMAGGPGMKHLLRALKPSGSLVLVGVLAGAQAELELFEILRKRLRIVGSVLRSRSRDEKERLVHAFMEFAERRLALGQLRPVIDRVYPSFAEIGEAYAQMERGGVWGKLVVLID